VEVTRNHFGVLAVVLGISMIVFSHPMADFFNGFAPTTLDSTRFRIGGGVVAAFGIVMSGIALMQ
jgi:hypothetical protein